MKCTLSSELLSAFLYKILFQTYSAFVCFSITEKKAAFKLDLTFLKLEQKYFELKRAKNHKPVA